MLQKNPFYEKVKMFTKVWFVIEFFCHHWLICHQVLFKILFVTTILGDQSSVLLLAKNV
jgi:hypothetical protein